MLTKRERKMETVGEFIKFTPFGVTVLLQKRH